jgi:peptide/nickel transport system permease protein
MVRHISAALAWRVCRALVLAIAVASAAFFLVHLAPGDFAQTSLDLGAPATERARQQAALGLDRPVLAQYLDWLVKLVRLDLGDSWLYQRPVLELVVERTGNTLSVSVIALMVASLAGLSLGTWRAGTGRRWAAFLLDVVSATLVSLPALLLTLVLAVVGASTGWYSVGGLSPDWWRSTDRGLFAALFLPVAAIAIPLAAAIERLQSRAVGEATGARFNQGLVARGVPLRRMTWIHATRVASAPVVSVFGFLAANVLNGSLTVELFLGWPGLGRLLVEGLSARDLPLVAGCVAAGTLIVTCCLAATGALAEALDPRGRAATDGARA